MAEHSQFDRDGERRIDRAVNAVERSRPDPLTRRPDDPEHAAGFWAQLTGEGSGSTAGWYSWKRVVRVPASASGWADATPAVTGTLNLREANGATGLYSASAPKRYFVTLNGYKADGALAYLFVAGGGSVDLKNADVIAVTAAGFINIPATHGTGNVLEFVANTADPTGGDLQLKNPGTLSTYKGIFWNGSAWVMDWVRAH